MEAKYDRIGKEYNTTRKADPYLFNRLQALLNPEVGKDYLDVGCGTGNYTKQFDQLGYSFVGLDPSQEMLDRAQEGNNSIQWMIGTADAIPFGNAHFDGAIATLTLHHWGDLESGFREVHRVLKPNSRWVIFTSDPQQMAHYWLCHYFPNLMQKGIDQMPRIDLIRETLSRTGFRLLDTENYAVKEDLQDLFLYSGKHQPERYFDERLRKGISTFSDLANATEVQKGLRKLREDIDSGKIQKVIREWQYDGGDYLFLVAQKE